MGEYQGVPFIPRRGEETDILNQSYKNGSLYFAEDTGKIYMDTKTENKRLMGGGANSGIFYANKVFIDPNDTKFTLEDINGDDLPSVNDLIINVSNDIERDGFYQVVEVLIEEQSVITNYLPVGGGGSGTGTEGRGTVYIDYVSPSTGVGQTLINEDYIIEFNLIAQDASGDTVLNSGEATLIINNVTVKNFVVKPGLNSVNLNGLLDSRRSFNTVRISVNINTGGAVNQIAIKSWQITAINLELSWALAFPAFIKEDRFQVSFTPYGNTECVAHLVFDNKITDSNFHYIKNISQAGTGSQQFFDTILVNNIGGHGVHQATMWLEAEINGTNYRTQDINKEIVCVDVNSQIPLITTDFYQTTASQWDNISIPYAAWLPNTNIGNISIYINDVLISENNQYINETRQNFTYTLGQPGSIKFEFRTINALPKKFDILVSPLALDGVDEPSGCEFELKANSIVDNNSLRNNEFLTFSENFDWENGGLRTEVRDGINEKYICVKNGTTLTINKELFSKNLTLSGKLFKIIFKAVNCYDYQAQVLTCLDDSGIGIEMNAQQAFFYSGTKTIKADYCEGSKIEFEAEVWPDTSRGPYMMIWLDGVQNTARKYTQSDTFIQGRKKNIVIGSNECDVYVYLVKIYDRSLNYEEHINNFILDASNSKEMLERYNRNNILDTRGDISYEKLVKANPGCHAYLYDINRMTTGKKDKVTCNSYTEYCNNSGTPITDEGTDIVPVLTAQEPVIRVQGTSSAAYGVGAFNLRTDFGAGGGLRDGEGNPVVGRKVSETSIPVDYTCTKVNVASCENVNNALNQEWYNRFQPYWDGHRRKARTDGNLYRDCMEFDFGVVFVKDRNAKQSYNNTDEYLQCNVFADDNNYMALSEEDRYYKQYAIGNMGNDKDNVEVFHDIDNPVACCIEITDNETDKQWMNVEITIDDIADTEEGTENYEFRYPDGNENATQEQRQAWVDFVNWMANSNPEKATGNDLEEEKTYGVYTFKGFDPPGWNTIPPEHKNYVSLKGLTVPPIGYNYSDEEKIEQGITYNSEKSEVTYTKDSEAYRTCKMLHECEDHLVMDSVVFHYLFILRHTMVDNVAKNTFWSTEDLQHWDLTKNYDNDTADGNNNSGELVFNYGLEIFDKIESGSSVFNALPSVWLQFIHRLPMVQKDLYSKLSSKGAWNSEEYLNLFKNKQQLIPERCWVYDYDRKYLRPARLNLAGGENNEAIGKYSDDKYIKKLDGGKKEHQRRQYETYQKYYLDSKYQSGVFDSTTASIDVRLKSTTDDGWANDSNAIIPISYYIDLYPRALIGGRNWQGERLKRGQVINIPVNQLITSATDSTCYIYASALIQTLSNLGYFSPLGVELKDAKKLRHLTVDAPDENKRNNNLNSLVVSGAPVLENLSAKYNGSKDTEDGAGVLDLANNKGLKALDATGSTFTQVNFPEKGIITSIKLDKPKKIIMKELSHLNSFIINDDYADKLKQIDIRNCPDNIVNTLQFVENCNITHYCLWGINWDIAENSLNADSSLVQIDVLNKLSQPDVLPLADTHATSLTGHIEINLPNTFNVNEYEIYSKYIRTYPQVDISYGENAIIEKAPKIIFYDSDDMNDKKVLYSVLSDKQSTIGFLTSEEGPTGIKIGTPEKNETYEYSYAWNIGPDREEEFGEGYTEYAWVDQNNRKYTQQEILAEIPTEDLELTPVFSYKLREYKVEFRDYDGSVIQTQTAPYNTRIDNAPIYIYRKHKNEEQGKRYVFNGWITAQDYLTNKKNPTIITDFLIISESVYYPLYTEENITTPSPNKYFNFTAYGTNGYTISLKEEYRPLVEEPITLPLTYNGKPIMKIGNFGPVRNESEYIPTKYKYIYFATGGNNEYVAIGDNAFGVDQISASNINVTALVQIDLPSTIKTIGAGAFCGCKNLTTIGNYNNVTEIGNIAFYHTNQVVIDIDSMTNLESIGTSAFYQAGPNITFTQKPAKLNSLPDWCFAYCRNIMISDFSQFDRIGGNCFFQGINTSTGGTTIKIDYAKIVNIGNSAFNNYLTGAKTLEIINYIDSTDVEAEQLSRVGLARAWSNISRMEAVQ